MGAKVCVDCGSDELLPRKPKGFRNRCAECQRAYQRRRYHTNHEQYLATQRRLYVKHAPKRRQESRDYKKDRRERYTLLEWFRKQGIAAADIPDDDLDALVEMKKAVNLAKVAVADAKPKAGTGKSAPPI